MAARVLIGLRRQYRCLCNDAVKVIFDNKDKDLVYDDVLTRLNAELDKV